MLRTNQKISWTRTEMQKFAEYDSLEHEIMMKYYDAMWSKGGITVGNRLHRTLKKMNDELNVLRDELKALMGTSRFNILMNDQFTLKVWRGQVLARFIEKHPWAAPEDCRPGWE